jgi:hypothetical protein
MSIPLIVAIPTALLGALGAVSQPVPAVLTWLALGVVAGGVTWAWTRFAWTVPPATARSAGLQVTALTGLAGLALGGSMVLLGAGTLVLLAAGAAWLVRAVLSSPARCAR